MKNMTKPIQLTLLAVLAGSLLLPQAHGFLKPNQGQASLPGFDARQTTTTPPFSAPDQQAALSLLHSNVPAVRISADAVLGTPRYVVSSRLFLTSSSLAAPGGLVISNPQPKQAPVVPDVHQPVRDFLNEYTALFGEGETALNSTTIKRDFVAPKNGLRTTVWQQMLDGLPVFEGVLVANITRQRELASISCQLVPQIQQVANTSVPNRAALIANPPVRAVQAVASAARNIGESLDETQISAVTVAEGVVRWQRFTAPTLRGQASVSLLWLPVNKQALRLCWDTTVTGQATGYMYRILIDATTGEVLIRRGLTRFSSPATYNVFTTESPTPMRPGCPQPCNLPPVQRELKTLTALNTTASPESWIPDTANTTRGNNVSAFLDRDGNQYPDLGDQPLGAANRVFDFPLDLTKDPSTYSAAAVVQAFYWMNFAHDQFYSLGFTEPAGNFQVANFSRGGSGGDAMQTSVQSAIVQDNAFINISPIDGQPPQMMLGLFTGPVPSRDSALDAQVLVHEYCHGVQERLVGGGVGLNYAGQTGALMEGWADFAALAMTTDPTTDVDGVFPMGAYLGQGIVTNFTQNYYFGIRRYPYSTDMTKNPLTFKDVSPRQASTHPGVPISPLFAPANPADAADVHNAGEVWGVMLWEARANLMKKHGTAGNDLMLQLMVDGMKLAPPNPNFLEARDAILLADRIDNGGNNLRDLYDAFIKRGLAQAAEIVGVTDVVEAFDPPPPVPQCSPVTVPAKHGNCITRNARFWMSYVYDATNSKCANLYRAIEANGGTLCLGFLSLPVTYENRDSTMNTTDAVMEAMGLYWRKYVFTGESSGLQDAKLPASKLCKFRKKLAVELIAAIANNVFLGTAPNRCGQFPADLIEQAGEAAAGTDVKLIQELTTVLRRFNSSGMANPLPDTLQLCSTYDKTRATQIARDPTTHNTCPGPNDSFETATPIRFEGTNSFSKAIYQDKLNLSKHRNVLGVTCAFVGNFAVWKILPEIGQTNRWFTVDTFSSNFDTVLTVFSDNLTGPSVCSDDDFGHPPQSLVRFYTDGLSTNYIVVGGALGSEGSLKIKVTSP
jgi:hypothetical protein